MSRPLKQCPNALAVTAGTIGRDLTFRFGSRPDGHSDKRPETHALGRTDRSVIVPALRQAHAASHVRGAGWSPLLTGLGSGEGWGGGGRGGRAGFGRGVRGQGWVQGGWGRAGEAMAQSSIAGLRRGAGSGSDGPAPPVPSRDPHPGIGPGSWQRHLCVLSSPLYPQALPQRSWAHDICRGPPATTDSP